MTNVANLTNETAASVYGNHDNIAFEYYADPGLLLLIK